MALGDVLHQREADAAAADGALLPSAPGRSSPRTKRSKMRSRSSGGTPGPAVDDADDDAAVLRGWRRTVTTLASPGAYLSALSMRLMTASWMARSSMRARGQVGLDLGRELDPLALGAVAVDVDRLGDGLADVAVGEVVGLPAALDPREVEHVLDERREPLALAAR